MTTATATATIEIFTSAGIDATTAVEDTSAITTDSSNNPEITTEPSTQTNAEVTTSSNDPEITTEPQTQTNAEVMETSARIDDTSTTPEISTVPNLTALDTTSTQIDETTTNNAETISMSTSNDNSTTAEPNETTFEGSGNMPSETTTIGSATTNTTPETVTSSRLTTEQSASQSSTVPTSRTSVSSATVLATNASTYFASSTPLVTMTTSVRSSLLFGVFEDWQFALVVVGGAFLSLFIVLGICCWCLKRKKTEGGKLTRMATMWETGNGTDGVLMVNIAPKTGLWNSTESLAKTTEDVGDATTINVFENQIEDDESVTTETLKRRQNSSISSSTANTNSITMSPQSRKLKKTLTKVEMPTLDKIKTDDLQKITESEKASDDKSETGSVFDDTNTVSSSETKKMETFSLSSDTTAQSNQPATTPNEPGYNIPTSPPPPPPLDVSTKEVDVSGAPIPSLDEKKVNSFLHDENGIPPPPPPPTT